jgi:outer membrane immunogenic protein
MRRQEMWRLIVTAGLAFAAAGPRLALAADLPAPYPAPQAPATYAPVVAAPPVYSWTGAYLGLNAGASIMRQGIATYTAGFNPGTGAITSNTGFAGGGQLGVNWQYRWAVFGLEADADYLSNKLRTRSSNGAFGESVTVNPLVTVRPRLGFAFDRAMFYASGGLAIGPYGATGSTTTASQGVSATRIGWSVAAGVEYAFFPNWTAKLEYLMSSLPGSTYSYSNLGVTVASPAVTDSQVRAGINYKFNF